ncbi:Cationic amino acid transporter 7, chloroplastic -like protein [Gossypium arboreum]|uniref:Cationic amino acid transporter 7, chloroplastic-like protein n=1 Tax=Gossypium arboreum TaxID=29729 RepID=A0A0B0NPK9_GOSAR|nr:cationic amino acid transporter 7, chloroplastic [Gossypium arboreum]KHG16483.1 Cationic amino acid transporter 7, chloroplastic -like protein [Gossypium arboreum]
MESPPSSFSTFRSYLRALAQTPSRFAHRAPSVSSSYEELSWVKSRSGSNMHNSLRWYDLIGLGIGGMVGAGVFVTTGRASRLYAGPAILISYAIAGLCALLSAFCYTEFAVHMPVAGGAFSYLRITFGEFAAFLTGANLIMEYVMSNAAVARGFTSYLSAAIGIPTAKWRFTAAALPKGFNEIDLLAVAVVLTVTLIICYSTRESSILNMILTTLHILFIIFVVLMGFWKGDWNNFTRPMNPNSPSGFFPYGPSGVFNGAAMVYFSYIGYDAVSTMAEEVRYPIKDIPIGVTGSVVIVTILYCLMAASMSMLLPYDRIDVEAPFAAAFSGRLEWVSKVIGVGASFGILTSLLVAMLGQARYMCVIGRSSVVPTWFARVHSKTSTPLNASAFLGIFTAAIALFTDLNILLNLMSIGTLFVYYMVANAVIYRRYVVIGTTKPWSILSFLCLLTLTSLLFTLSWHFAPSGSSKSFLLGLCIGLATAITLIFRHTVPQVRKPEFWGVPFMPWLPSISIFMNIFLLGSLDGQSYVRFGFFSGLAVLVYVLYSVHASFDAEAEGLLGVKNGEMIRESSESEEDPNHKV